MFSYFGPGWAPFKVQARENMSKQSHSLVGLSSNGDTLVAKVNLVVIKIL